ncbi:MAG: hypothetical protein AAF288_06735 [Planctomycetota bacterium]
MEPNEDIHILGQVRGLDYPKGKYKIEGKVYCAAWIDLLGQGEELRQVAAVRDPGEQSEAFKKVAKQTLGAVIDLRKSIDASVQEFTRLARSEMRPMSDHEWVEMKRLRSFELTCKPYSDALCVHIPTVNTMGFWSVAGIQSIMHALILCIPGYLITKHPVRGAVDVGIGMEISDSELYGPVLANVVHMESKVAVHPRVIVGQGMREFVNSMAAMPDDSPGMKPHEIRVCRAAASRMQSFFARDRDGEWILHYLGKPVLDMLDDDGKWGDYLKQAFKSVCASIEEARNPKVRAKYEWVAEYFTRWVPHLTA